MADQTNYHGWTTPTPRSEAEADEWAQMLVDLIDGDIDDTVTRTGLIADRPDTAPDDALYRATDETTLYQFDGDAGAWDDITPAGTVAGGGAPSLSFVADDVPRSPIYAGQNPAAVYIESEDTTFITYRGPGADPWATAYHHDTGAWDERTFIDNSNEPDTDAHDNPALCIDDNGTLHAVYGSHNTAHQYAHSTNPYDTTAWDVQGTLGTVPVGTYPSPAALGNDLYVLYRSGDGHDPTYPSHEYATIIHSPDGGATWNDLGPVIDTSGHPDSPADAYAQDLDVLGATGADALHLSWTVAHGGHNNNRDNIYHAIYDPANDTMESLSGESFAAPVTWDQMEGSDMRAFVSDGSSSPKHAALGDTVVLTHAVPDGDGGGAHHAHTWDPDAGTWDNDAIPNATADSRFTTSTPRFADDGSLEVHAITAGGDPNERSGHYHRFVREDGIGGAWEKDLISPAPPDSDGWAPVGVVLDGPDEFPSLVGEWTADPTEHGMRFLAYGRLGNSGLAVRTTGRAGDGVGDSLMRAFPAATGQTIPGDGTFTPVGFDSVSTDDFADLDFAGVDPGNDELVVPEDGTYHLLANIRLSGVADGSRIIARIDVNGNEMARADSHAGVTGGSTLAGRVSDTRQLAAGDTVTCSVWQDSGAGCDVRQAEAETFIAVTKR